MKNKIITGIALCSLFITGCSLDKSISQRSECVHVPGYEIGGGSGRLRDLQGPYPDRRILDAVPGIQDNASDIGASRINAANYNYQQQSKLRLRTHG